MKKRVADILFDTLADNGVTQVFCVVGGGAMFLDNALGVSPRMKTLFQHHEQACAMAAEAYARYRGIPAVCCVTSGPGGTNALTGVMGAYEDSIPMIVVSGQVRHATTVAESGLKLRRRGEQEFAIVEAVRGMTKYAAMVVNPLDIRMEVQKAFDIAVHGRRGPVWLDIPLDVQSCLVEEEDLTPPLSAPKMLEGREEEVLAVLDTLQKASAPCILAGSGIAGSHLQRRFHAVLEKLCVPVVSAAVLCDVMYRAHPLSFGATGGVGSRCGNLVMQNADVLLVLGCSLGYKQTTFDQQAFAPKAHVIMVDADACEAEKAGLHVETFVHADLAWFFRAVEKSERRVAAPPAWMAYCNRLKAHFDVFEGAKGLPGERVDAYNFWKEYSRQEEGGALTVLGNSSSIIPRLQTGGELVGQRTFANINCGSMGYDLPAGIGVHLASGHPVTVVTGDGSFMMNMQELQTIVHNRLAVKMVLFSNDGYRSIEQTCRTYFNGYNVGCTPETGISMPDFAKVAGAFSLPYRRCSTNAELAGAVAWLKEQDGPCLLELLQKYDNPPCPVVKSRLGEDGRPCRVELHDMFPFLAREELARFMFDAQRGGE